jgi:hypothetical protein
MSCCCLIPSPPPPACYSLPSLPPTLALERRAGGLGRVYHGVGGGVCRRARAGGVVSKTKTRGVSASSKRSALSIAQEELVDHLRHEATGARLLDGWVEVVNIKDVHLTAETERAEEGELEHGGWW